MRKECPLHGIFCIPDMRAAEIRSERVLSSVPFAEIHGELRGAWYYQDASAEPEETPPADVIIDPGTSPDEPSPSPEPGGEPSEPAPDPDPTPEPEPSASVIIVGG